MLFNKKRRYLTGFALLTVYQYRSSMHKADEAVVKKYMETEDTTCIPAVTEILSQKLKRDIRLPKSGMINNCFVYKLKTCIYQ